jgi:Alb1
VTPGRQVCKALLSRIANPRSRAAKRAASPSIDTDKSIKDARRATDATPVLAARHNGGIQKAKKKVKPMKRGQRARQEKGLARAEAVTAQMEKKVEEIQTKAKKRNQRRAIWEEVNEASLEEKRKTPKLQVLENGARGDDDEWEDVPQAFEGDTEMKVVDGVQVPAAAGEIRLTVAVRTASANASEAEDYEEIT